MASLLTNIGLVMTAMIGWIGDFIGAMVGESGDLVELWALLAIGITVSVVMLIIKVVRGFTWGA